MKQNWIARALLAFALAAAALPLSASLAVADGAPSIDCSPPAAPPGFTVTVSGSGLGIYEAVDVYFDATDEALTVTDGTGAFSTSITIPSNASYQTHWVTAVGRHSGLAAQTPFVVSSNWPQFRRGAYHQATDPHESQLSPTTVGHLGLDWTYQTGGQIESSPAVVDGVVYIGSGDGNVYALSASTGALIWSHATGGDIGYSSPSVVNGVVYIGSSDGNLYALDASTGGLLWSRATANSGSSPAIVNGVLYDVRGNSTVYALSASTGTLRWSHSTGGISGSILPSSPAVANGVVYVGSSGNRLYALRASTGAFLWSRGVGDSGSSPAVANGLVYIGSYLGYVRAFKASTGGLVWSGGSNGNDNSPAVANGVVYVGFGDGNIYALNASTGAPLWSYQIGGSGSSPAVADGGVYVGGNDGTVYAFAPASRPGAVPRPDASTLRPTWSLTRRRG